MKKKHSQGLIFNLSQSRSENENRKGQKKKKPYNAQNFTSGIAHIGHSGI